jgi:cAMP-dependent protein kinase regulator
MAQPLEDDTLEKIHSYVKDMDINGTYVDMTEQLLMFRPENPIRFMIDYLSFKHKDSIEKGCYLRSEEEGKGDEGVKWTWTDKKDMPSSDRGESKMADDLDIASDSEDDDDDYVDELPVVKTRTQRKAVSSGVATDLSGFEPKKVEKSIDEREKIMSILTSNNFFSQVTDEQRAIMADAMTKAEFKDGAEVIKQGDQGDTFYVLDSGVADVWVSKDGAEPAKVFTYEEGSGAAFGELALLYNSPRAATVRANGPVSLWALDQMTFKYTMQQNTTATRDTNVGWLKQVSLLADLSEVESFKIADALRTVKFAKGDSIITQGDKGDYFYVIEEVRPMCSLTGKRVR